MRHKYSKEADICLILEGTYPYTMGGVSSWTHDLITMQNHLSFAIVAIVSADAPTKLLYKLPNNVISLKILRLQQLPEGSASLSKKDYAVIFRQLEQPLLNLQSHASLDDLASIISIIQPYKNRLGKRLLLDSQPVWNMLVRMYQSTMPKTSFLDYFWSWRGLFGGLFSILLSPIPPAKAYHALCTGYAGVMLARAHLETGKPCIVTEHGIYTNERRIEIANADWLHDVSGFNLSILKSDTDRQIKDFWIDTFGSYSRLCYEACTKIVTLYKGNQEFQLMDGADPSKLMVIPNGIDFDKYASIEHVEHSPTVALIGRVVSIKDIKTYIKAIAILKESLPEIQALIIGPTDEEPEYAIECYELVEHLDLKQTLLFTGKVNIEQYLKVIDVIVLTSISEAQPLVILEAGAAGIPTIATDVGACREMIMGDSLEKEKFGAGGIIVPLSNPRAVSKAMLKLFTNKPYYNKCSKAISSRVSRYYNKEDQYKSYANLYSSITGESIERHEYETQKILEEVV